jgi:PBSX family phage terminase large subunit
MTLCLAYGDELTTVPEAFYAQVLYRLSVKGAQLFGTTNPDNPMHWLRKKYLLRAGELNLRTWHSTLDDNPHLDPEYVANAKLENVGMWYKRYILGLWVMAEGAIYDMWDEDRHVVDVLPLMQRWIALGIDYGTNAPFAALLLGLGTDRNLYLGAEYRHDSKKAMRQLSAVEYSRAMRTWLANIPVPGTSLHGVRPDMIIVDPAELQFRVQLTNDGLVTHGANNNVMDGIRTVSSLLATDRLKVHRSCAGWIEEAPGYSWDPDKALLGEDAPVKLDDHSLDAGRYAVHTTSQLWTPAIRPAFALAA